MNVIHIICSILISLTYSSMEFGRGYGGDSRFGSGSRGFDRDHYDRFGRGSRDFGPSSHSGFDSSLDGFSNNRNNRFGSHSSGLSNSPYGRNDDRFGRNNDRFGPPVQHSPISNNIYGGHTDDRFGNNYNPNNINRMGHNDYIDSIELTGYEHNNDDDDIDLDIININNIGETDDGSNFDWASLNFDNFANLNDFLSFYGFNTFADFSKFINGDDINLDGYASENNGFGPPANVQDFVNGYNNNNPRGYNNNQRFGRNDVVSNFYDRLRD